MPDALRLLHRDSTHAYTDNPAEAMPQEPEVVPASYQRELTADAHRAADAAQAAEWQERKTGLLREVSWLESQRFRRDVRGQIRALRRQIDRLDRTLGGEHRS